MEIVVGDLCSLDGDSLVLVLAVQHDGISEDYVCILLNDSPVWVSRFRLVPIPSD